MKIFADEKVLLQAKASKQRELKVMCMIATNGDKYQSKQISTDGQKTSAYK